MENNELRDGRLLVGELARAAEVNVQTVHYYERRGLLRSPQRMPSGYRIYDPGTVTVLQGIKRAQELGFTLSEIRELMALQSRRSPHDVVGVLAGKMRDLDDKIRDLQVMRRSLQKGSERCQCGGDLSSCDVLSGLGGKRGRDIRDAE